MKPTIRVQSEDFDIAAEIEAVTAGNRDVGAVVTFSGVCRDEGNRLAALELEHYPGMAEEEMGRIAEQAGERWRAVLDRKPPPSESPAQPNPAGRGPYLHRGGAS